MSIDRGDYEPIQGNPRRKTKSETPEETEETTEGSPSGPSGDHADGGQAEGPNGDPVGTTGSHSPAPNASEPEDEGTYKTPQGRTKRVKVTPQDWKALKEAAERLGGLPHSKVYNRAFQELRKRLDGL
jgi:hypothetical protein